VKGRNAILGISVVVVALAVLVFAGNFYGDGTLYPCEGWANETEFLYEIAYWLDPEQEPPAVSVKMYESNVFKFEEMMSIKQVMSMVVYYEYETKLDAGDWSFEFETVDDETLRYIGPTVREH